MPDTILPGDRVSWQNKYQQRRFGTVDRPKYSPYPSGHQPFAYRVKRDNGWYEIVLAKYITKEAG